MSNNKKRKNMTTEQDVLIPRKFSTQGRAVRIYADGVYDMFHYGHARSLEQAKLLFPNTHLIVGVTSDEDTEKYKGKTVFNEDERAEMVMHCRYVDEVVPRCPWIITPEFVKKHNIDFVVHGEDPCVSPDGEDVYKVVKEMGKFRFIKRTEGVSTSDLIMRLLRDYDVYLKRNLKRGYSRHDLNISFLKEQQLKLGEVFSWSPSTVSTLFQNAASAPATTSTTTTSTITTATTESDAKRRKSDDGDSNEKEDHEDESEEQEEAEAEEEEAEEEDSYYE